jgi:plastocyanin
MRSVSRPATRCGLLAAAVVLAACSSNGNPADPSDNTDSIVITSNNGAQSFSPNPAALGGQTIVFRNNHNEIHHILANDGSFNTGEIAPGATSVSVLMPAAGTNYHCTIHPTMVGAVGGTGGSAPPPCEGAYC